MPNFYGKQVSTLKLFGQERWGDCSPGRVTGEKIYHAAGVLVDRSSTPNHIYVADSGNNRILGFRSYRSPKPDLILGQPDEFSSAPNGDCNTGEYARPSRSSLCLMDIPGNTNLAEQWRRFNFDVDAEGNLYFPDAQNNRVLIYKSPFRQPKPIPQLVVLPDMVLGQDDFESNGINRGLPPGILDARSLFLSFRADLDAGSTRGVSVDPEGNVWVADTLNSRVLRFPKGATRANLVLGQRNFNESTAYRDEPGNVRMRRMHAPLLARINPDTGELYVIDELSGRWRARILVFNPPFSNGMPATRVVIPRQRLEGDYADGYELIMASGLVFNPFKTDDWIDEETQTHRYRDGVFWLHDDNSRTLLLDAEGNILLAIGAPDLITRGGQEGFYPPGTTATTPFNLTWPGGMIGFDSRNNIYLADESWHRIARFALPYRVRRAPDGRPILPRSNGGLFPGKLPNSVDPVHTDDRTGAITFRNQLIVRNTLRYLAWNNYRSKPNRGAPADVIVGQADGFTISDETNRIVGSAKHTIDNHDRLWTHSEHGELMVYQLPLTNGAQPIQVALPLYWARAQTKISFFAYPVAFEHSSQKLWVFDAVNHRLLRVQNPDDLRDKNLLVDVVIGQQNKTDGAINRGMPRPDDASFGHVSEIKFDKLGNLFVVDNNYECSHNGRIIVFMAQDLSGLGKEMFPAIKAKKVFVADGFDRIYPEICRRIDTVDSPYSPVSVAFNSRNEMVVGNDGYYSNLRTRNITQLYLYRTPLTKQTPDAVIELPVGAPGELSFDEQDNLIVQDATYSKLWVINFDRDPVWLREL